MLAALVIVFREVLEAGLVVGVVLAATRRVPGRTAYVAGGLVAGFLGACVVAAFAGELAALFQGSGQEMLNGAVLLVAVIMLAWHNAWMASHGRDLARHFRAIGHEVSSGRRPLTALAVVCCVAVFREGSEVVLFLYGVAAGGGASSLDIVVGGLLGIAAGALVSALLYLGLIAIPLRYLFGTLTVLITLLAAGLAAQAVGFFQQGGWMQAWSDPVWSTSAWLAQDSLIGRVLHTLVGYMDQPNGDELIAYAAVILAMVVLTSASARQARHRGTLNEAHAP